MFNMMKASFIVVLLAASGAYCNVTTTYSQKEVCNSYFDEAINVISNAKYKIQSCYTTFNIQRQKPSDCFDVLYMGQNKSGVYEIWPINRITERKSIYVYCDMDTNEGGWTVIQRRGDFKNPIDYFYRNWETYKEGFGNIKQDFWLGNDNIYALTNQKLYSVRFDLKDIQQDKRYALYDKFWIDDENHKYTLHIYGYTGDAGNSMYYHNNRTFSTFDRDTTGNCAKKRKGGWWYDNCALVNLNGIYFKGKHTSDNGTTWRTWKGDYESLEWVEIKIRPKYFSVPFS